MRGIVLSFFRDQNGQAVVEYTLAVAMAGTICLAGLLYTGATFSTTVNRASTTLSYALSTSKPAASSGDVQVVDSIVYRKPVRFTWHLPSWHLNGLRAQEGESPSGGAHALGTDLSKKPAAAGLAESPRGRASMVGTRGFEPLTSTVSM